MKIIVSLILLLSLLCIMACTKDITFKGSGLRHTERLVIEGILYPEETARIYISSSVSFFNEKVLPQEIFARGAQVMLATDTWVEMLQPDSVFDKFRCRWVPFYGGSNIIEQGKTYELQVNYEGAVFSANTTIEQPKVNLDEVEYISEFYDVYGGHDGVIIRFRDAPGSTNFYRFQMDRMMDNTRLHAHVLDGVKSDCTEPGELFMTTDLGRVIFSDVGNDGRDMEFNVEVSFEYKEGDSATVYLQSLDPRAAAFFKDLDDQLQSVFNPFVEPSFIHTTIDGALGVFGSAVRSDPIPFVYPRDNP